MRYGGKTVTSHLIVALLVTNPGDFRECRETGRAL